MLYPAELRARCGAALLDGESEGRKCVASFFFTAYAIFMNRPLLRLLTPVLATILLAGCAADPTAYPSLAPRAVEKLGFEEPVTPPAPLITDPALDARIAAAAAKRADAARAFDAAATRAERLARAARGAAAGSDRWLDAQTALAELDSLRAAHGEAAGVLEHMAAQRAQALLPAYPALEKAREEAKAAATAQTQRIDALTRALAPA